MRVFVYYDKDDHPVAEGTSASDLARKIGVTPGAVLHGLRRGSKRYEQIDIDELDGGE